MPKINFVESYGICVYMCYEADEEAGRPAYGGGSSLMTATPLSLCWMMISSGTADEASEPSITSMGARERCESCAKP